MSGDTLVISDHRYKGGWLFNRKGAVHVYSNQGDQWGLETTMYPPISDVWEPNFEYGLTICIKGNRLLIGARAEMKFNGTAYVYEKINDKWILLFRPIPDVSSLYDFCRAVAITDDYYFISSTGGFNSTPVFIYNH